MKVIPNEKEAHGDAPPVLRSPHEGAAGFYQNLQKLSGIQITVGLLMDLEKPDPWRYAEEIVSWNQLTGCKPVLFPDRSIQDLFCNLALQDPDIRRGPVFLVCRPVPPDREDEELPGILCRFC
jgi:hypothetical protein